MFGGGGTGRSARSQRPESAPAQRRTSTRGGSGQRPGSATASRPARPESARAQRRDRGGAGLAGGAGTGAGGGRAGRAIRWRCHFKNTVYAAFSSRAGWQELAKDADGHYGATDHSWDIVWSDRTWAREHLTNVKLSDWQRINHFRNNYELTRKDHMVKNLKRMRKSLEKEGRVAEAAQWDFFPTTYVLPQEYGLLHEEYKRNPDSTWIMKPVGSAQGRGIFLFTKLSQISEWKVGAKWRPNVGGGQSERAAHTGQPEVENYVAQKYIDRPFLIGAKKFDLRLYCLVTTFSPLTVWLYRAGFCRFSNHRFSMAKADLHRTHVHLTNVAVQKTAEDGEAAGPGTMGEEGDWENDGSKWDLSQLKLYVASRHGMSAANTMCTEMQMVMVRTLIACQPVMINDKHCFELYGFDVRAPGQSLVICGPVAGVLRDCAVLNR